MATDSEDAELRYSWLVARQIIVKQGSGGGSAGHGNNPFYVLPPATCTPVAKAVKP